MRIQSIRFLLTLLLSVFIFTQVKAQTESYGIWSSIGIEKDIKKWEFSAETELRTIYIARLIDRWSIGIGTDYELNKFLKIGLGYQFMNALDYDPDYSKFYFIRNRIFLSATGKYKLSDFTFSLRERAQFTVKEDRIKTDGTVDDYNINPAWVWRNKFQIEYNIPKCKITPAVSIESFFDLNNPDGNNFENIRYILSFDYKLNKHNHIEIFGVVNSSLLSDDAYGKYILGLSYKHSL